MRTGSLLVRRDGERYTGGKVAYPEGGEDGAHATSPRGAGGSAYIADARAGAVIEVDLESFTVADRLEVGGEPASVAVLEQEE